MPEQTPVRSLRRRLAPQIIAELVERYNAGEQRPALSREYALSKSGLRKLLLAAGVTFRGHVLTPEDAAEAVRLYQDGLTIKQVVGEVGYSYGTIRTVLHEHGVAMRSAGRWKRDERGVQETCRLDRGP